jgi:hypothetical protein
MSKNRINLITNVKQASLANSKTKSIQKGEFDVIAPLLRSLTRSTKMSGRIAKRHTS